VPASIGIFREADSTLRARRGVIYALGLSPLDEKVIWAGTDDGFVHMSPDGGVHWKNVTPPALTAWSKVAGIDAGHFDSRTAYVAVNRIRLDDMHPHIFRTHDGGSTWKEIVAGLPDNGPVNAVREDPGRRGLLIAGTERAVFCSFDDGASWLPLRLNMPATSVRDLVIHDNDVIVGTHGRSFWELDDISPLRQWKESFLQEGLHLFRPGTARRVRWNSNTDTPLPPEEPAGENPPDGAVIDYYLHQGARNVALEIRDLSGSIVRRYSSSDPPAEVNERELRIPTYWIRPFQPLGAGAGHHRFVWDLHYAPPEGVPLSYPIAATVHNTAPAPRGPWVAPGVYSVVLEADGKKSTQQIEVAMDPRVKVTPALLGHQFELSMKCYNGLGRIHGVITQLHHLSDQIRARSGQVSDAAVKDSLSFLDKKLHALEGGGVAEDVDAMYFSVEDTRTIKQTLSALQTKLLYAMTLLQNADAEPTVSQGEALSAEEQAARGAVDWWEKFKASGFSGVNKNLRRLNLKPLQAE